MLKVPFVIDSQEFLPRQKIARNSEVNKGVVELSGETSFYKPDENKSDSKVKALAETQKAFNRSKKTDDPTNIISQIESRVDTALRLSKTSFGHRTKSTFNAKPNPYLSKGFKENELI
jgi:hypothetical protein